jgi:hypothetical protein
MIDLENCRAFAAQAAAPDERLQVLERIVLDLMMEIEALRAAVVELSAWAGSACECRAPSVGVTGPHDAYGKAYLKTAWLSHWAAGPSSGADKILAQFYGDERADGRHEAIRWRELSMLRRLRYSAEQLKQYLASARAAETCT